MVLTRSMTRRLLLQQEEVTQNTPTTGEVTRTVVVNVLLRREDGWINVHPLTIFPAFYMCHYKQHLDLNYKEWFDPTFLNFYTKNVVSMIQKITEIANKKAGVSFSQCLNDILGEGVSICKTQLKLANPLTYGYIGNFYALATTIILSHNNMAEGSFYKNLCSLYNNQELLEAAIDTPAEDVVRGFNIIFGYYRLRATRAAGWLAKRIIKKRCLRRTTTLNTLTKVRNLPLDISLKISQMV